VIVIRPDGTKHGQYCRPCGDRVIHRELRKEQNAAKYFIGAGNY
jgi:hypothetical protein